MRNGNLSQFCNGSRVNKFVFFYIDTWAVLFAENWRERWVGSKMHYLPVRIDIFSWHEHMLHWIRAHHQWHLVKHTHYRSSFFYVVQMSSIRHADLSCSCVVAERPQHMLMRVAVGIHQTDIDAVIETYNLLSEKWFTHASPTLFNAGTNRPQLSR